MKDLKCKYCGNEARFISNDGVIYFCCKGYSDKFIELAEEAIKRSRQQEIIGHEEFPEDEK